MPDIANLIIRVDSQGVARAERDLDRLETQGRRTERATDGLSRTFKTMGLAVGAVAAGMGALAARDLVNTTVEFERLQASLVTVTGSTIEAQQEFDKLQDFAATTPYQLSEVTSAFIKMKAMGLDASQESLRSYGNTASAMGKDLNQMIEAVADAATGEFERLKEFGIKASSEGDRVKLTFRGVTTEIGKNAAEIEQYLRRIGEVDFAGGMERQMDTMGGKLSNLSDAWDKFLFSLGQDTGSIDAAKSSIEGVTAALDGLTVKLEMLRYFKSGTVSIWEWLGSSTEEGRGILADIDSKSPEEMAVEKAEKRLKLLNSILDIEDDPPQTLINEIKYLKETIEYYKVIIPLRKELDSALQHNASRVPDYSESSKDLSQDNTNASGEFELLTRSPFNARSLADDARENALKDANDARDALLERLMEQNRTKYASDITAGRNMASDPWMTGEFEDGLDAASERLWQMQEAQVSWKLSVIEGLEELGDYYEETFEDRVAGTVASAFTTMEETMVDFVMTGKASFSDLVNSILADISRLMIQESISKPLAGILSGLSGGGNIGSYLFNSAKYSVPSAVSGVYSGNYDSGGSIPAGAFGIAGEYGPEIIPGPATVISRKETEKLMGGGEVNVQINNYGDTQPRVEKSTNSQGGTDLIITLEKELSNRMQSRGSRLSNTLESLYGLRRTGGR